MIEVVVGIIASVSYLVFGILFGNHLENKYRGNLGIQLLGFIIPLLVWVTILFGWFGYYRF